MDLNENNLDSSVVWTSFSHHAGDHTLKSPVITTKDVLDLLISLKRWSRLGKNESNSQLVWLGKQ